MNLAHYLLIDASSPNTVVVAQLDASGRRWAQFTEEPSAALEGIFSASEKVCPQFSPAGFLFCEGPGSILGIRIAAAAIRGRNALGEAVPVLAFQSLRLVAALIASAFPQEKNFAILAESRMNAWNFLQVENGISAEDFRELKTPELEQIPQQKIFLLPQRRPTPPPFPTTPVNPAELLKADPAIFAKMPELIHDCGNTPDAANTSAASGYAKWTPERHR
jgi:tRNA threonylcarbamoyladenosine biosynthesis protein TsaB